MRFFTREWRQGRGLPLDGQQLLGLYAEHLDSLKPPLPEHVRDLALNVDLHDAFLHQLTLKPSSGEVYLCLRAGDLQRGYFDAGLTYRAAEFSPQSDATLERASRTRDELLDHEFDGAPPNKWLHRFLFHESGEAAIAFDNLSWTRAPKEGRFDGTAA